jgi:ammonium transporter, Amt family
MRRRHLGPAFALAAVALLALPSFASADVLDRIANLKGSIGEGTDALNTTWVIVAACLVMFMQAGFLLLEVGFSRMKNVGAGVAKIMVNFSIASLCYWAVGFALAFGGAGTIAGDSGFFLDVGSTAAQAGEQFPFVGLYGIDPAAFLFFQFAFCAVSLAIVWGTTLERIKFGAYVLYAIAFCAVIYPVISHWIFGGGWLQVNIGMQDFAGSTVVHLIGATGALAALLLLGPRRGKYTTEGRPRAIPGHSMPLVGLGVIILWLGWFGFNPGSTLGVFGDAAAGIGNRFAEIVLVTNLAAAAGVIAAVSTMYALRKTIDIGMAGNGAIAGLVAITAPSGYVEYWAAPIIGAVGGIIVVVGVLAIEKVLDDPVGALSAHGLAGVWGTLACGLFTSPRFAEFNAVGDAGLWYQLTTDAPGGTFSQLGAQALGVAVAFACVFIASYAVFARIKATIGLRVTAEEEDAGLDISEHGMYGYPEQFIPPEEYPGSPTPAPVPRAEPAPVATMRAERPSEA